ncbi:MAG: patatin-like phospholipase family protein [Actinomycetota bacterium]|nr:patatin-like phospholipase family protein [Actinomycetota bacterium]
MRTEEFTQASEVQELLGHLRSTCEGKQFSDVIDDQGYQYVDLVMEGGGVLGVALVGYTFVLEEMGLRFLRVGGTSAGSINALLVAGLGTPQERKSEKIVKELANVDFWSFVDGGRAARAFVQTLVRHPSLLGLGFRSLWVFRTVFKQLGLNPGEAFYDWLSGLLSSNGIRTTRDLKERMAQLPPSLRTRDGEDLTPPHLALVAADISTQTKVEFPNMAPLYWSDSDSVNPALYVRASMSIPGFFYPLRVASVPQGPEARQRWTDLASYEDDPPETVTFVDGGIMSNFPIDLFHLPDKIPVAPTFGAKLGPDERKVAEINSPQRLGAAVFGAASHTLDYDFIKRNPDYRKLVAYIDTGQEHGWLDFDMSDKDKIDLFVRGARKAAEFLTTFDWEGYKELRRFKTEFYAQV